MIAHLSGTLRDKQLQRLIVDVGGVGYDVRRAALDDVCDRRHGQRPSTLRIHTHVREDALQLFGFATALEQTLFERLISVSGIGPKVALAILSGIEPAELTRAIRSSDVARLTRIPGVGKKTAERVVLELKDRLPQPAAAEPAPRPSLTTTCAQICCRRSSISAINRANVEKTVDKVLHAAEDRSFEPLLRETLKLLIGR